MAQVVMSGIRSAWILDPEVIEQKEEKMENKSLYILKTSGVHCSCFTF